jgi:hypothetical protein
MGGFTTVIVAFVYLLIVVAVGIYLLVLLTRFVKAHQRGAEALEVIAKKISSSTGNS